MPASSLPRLVTWLGPAKPIARLNADSVAQLSSEFPIRDFWEDLRVLAARFHQAAGSSDEVASRLAWHHLVMAVVNAKSRGTPVRLGGRAFLDAVEAEALESFAVPAASGAHRAEVTGAFDPPLLLCAGDPQSWAGLSEAIPGLTIQTATTLLAVLWPGRHATLDNLVIGALIGLQAMDGNGVALGDLTIEALNIVWREAVTGTKTWADYDWYLETLQATACLPEFEGRRLSVTDIERALTLVGGRASGYHDTEWPEWDLRLQAIIDDAEETFRSTAARFSKSVTDSVS